MRTKVQRWGNSLAVRIPKSFAQEVGLVADAPVELHIADGALVITRAPVAPPTLEELLEAVTADNLHGEVDAGPAHGAEVW